MRKLTFLAVAAALAALLASCSDRSTSPEKPVGTEGGSCYGNGTCNAGLTCASNLCVRLVDQGLVDQTPPVWSDQFVPYYDLGVPDAPVPDAAVPDASLPDASLPDAGKCASLTFTGTARVAVPNSSALYLGTTISMLAWVNVPWIGPPPGGGSVAWFLFDNGKSGVYCPAYGMGIDSTGHLRFTARGGQGSQKCLPEMTATSTGIVPTKKWVHVTAVYDTNVVRLCIDSVCETISVTTVTPYQPIHDLWIGGEEGPHAAPGGSMSDAQLWSRALSTAEVQQAMKSGVAGVANKTGLVGSWAFDEGAGGVAGDSSGNKIDGTIVGATWSTSCPWQ